MCIETSWQNYIHALNQDHKMWPNFRKLLMYALQYFCNKPQYKTMGKIQKSNSKIMQVIDCLNSQWINTLNNKSWVSLCLLAHWEFENLCLVLVLGLVLELWQFVHVAMTKEFMDNLFSVNTPSLSAQKYIWTVNYILVGGEIPGK